MPSDRSPRRSSPRTWLARASLPLVLAAAAVADSDELSAGAHLSSAGLRPGTPLLLTLRSPYVGAPATLAVTVEAGAGPSVHSRGPVVGVKYGGAPSFVLQGSIGPDGRLVLAQPVPELLFRDGGQLVARAVVRGPGGELQRSNVVTLRPAAGPAVFADESFRLAPQVAAHPSADVDFADLDGDGRPEAVVANDGPGAWPQVLRNQPGFLSDVTFDWLPTAARVPAACVELADVDGDGDVDLFVGGGASADGVHPGANALLLNDGSGVFSPTSFPAGAGYALDAEFGDVDGDGDRDLVVANRADGDFPLERPDATVLYVNQGGAQSGVAGAFVVDGTFGSLPGNSVHGAGGDVSLADVDADGDLDLFVSRSDPSLGGEQNRLFLNDGHGAFTDVTAVALPAVADNSDEADFADFDGDGLLDLFVANSVVTSPVAVHLLRNLGVAPDGIPRFADASAGVPADWGEATGIRLSTDVGDVDGDGDPDVLVGIHEFFTSSGATGGEAVLLLNQGGRQGGQPGTFAVDTAFTTHGAFVDADVALVDVDGDGDLDAYVASAGDFFGTQAPLDRLLVNRQQP